MGGRPWWGGVLRGGEGGGHVSVGGRVRGGGEGGGGDLLPRASCPRGPDFLPPAHSFIGWWARRGRAGAGQEDKAGASLRPPPHAAMYAHCKREGGTMQPPPQPHPPTHTVTGPAPPTSSSPTCAPPPVPLVFPPFPRWAALSLSPFSVTARVGRVRPRCRPLAASEVVGPVPVPPLPPAVTAIPGRDLSLTLWWCPSWGPDPAVVLHAVACMSA